MKNNNEMFERMGKILNPKNEMFENVFVCSDYAVNTLINGNIKECIDYLRRLIGTGITGMSEATEQLSKIKENCPDKYQYVRNKVFSLYDK